MSCSDNECNFKKLQSLFMVAQKILVFSGSGLSATSGMSTFSTVGGLYDRAKQKYRLADGKTLFTYNFYNRHRREADAFFSDIYLEALKAHPSVGHTVLSQLAKTGRMIRHYTLNIDGLAKQAGMDTWHPEDNPHGVTVEMHGSVHDLVCINCGDVVPLNIDTAKKLQAHTPVTCSQCPGEDMRFKVMLYDDADGEYITPDDVMDLMEEDVKQADLILWVGISFQQSASTTYFRNVRHWLQEASKHLEVRQAVINPSDEALWNVLTASSNQRRCSQDMPLYSACIHMYEYTCELTCPNELSEQDILFIAEELNVLEVLGTADDILLKLLQETDVKLEDMSSGSRVSTP